MKNPVMERTARGWIREPLALLCLVGLMSAPIGVVSAAGSIQRPGDFSSADHPNALVASTRENPKSETNSAATGAEPRLGEPLLFDGGPPDGPNAFGIRGYSVADDFVLSSAAVVESVRIYFVTDTTFEATGTFRFFSDGGGGLVGSELAAGNLTNTVIQDTGMSFFGLTLSTWDADLDPPVSLAAGTYWFSPELDNSLCDGGGIFWVETAGTVGSGAREAEGCGVFPSDPIPNSFAFQLYGGCQPDVLIVYADNCVSDLQGMLAATGSFGAVDTFNGNVGVPTLATLESYDVVIFYSNANWADTTAIGNVAADYFDAGGGVVTATFSNTGCCNSQMLGRWLADGYNGLVPQGFGNCETRQLGTVYDSGHPIMQGVASVDVFCAAEENAITSGSVLIAELSDGTPLVVTKNIGGREVVDLGLFPISFDCEAGYNPSSDADTLIANAVLYAANCSGGGPVDPCLEDTDDPIILDCPGDFSTPCNTPGGFNLDYTPLVDDACDTTFTVDPDGTLPYGTTLVTVTVTDQAGNEATCSFNVTVTPDVQEPLRAASIGTEDGYVREPDMVLMAEGPAVTKGTTAQVGDDSGNWQNRGVFSFDTSALPDDAVVTTVTLRLTRASSAGNTVSLGNLLLDMGGSLIGANAGLDTFDYDDSAAAALDVATSFPVPAGNGFTTFASVDSSHNGLVDVTGRTQFRVRFETLSDGDNQSDYIAFHTGEASAIVRPELIVEYYTPSCFEYPELDPPCDGPFETTLWSTPAEDGGVGESHYTSEVGGSFSAGSGTAAVGDTGSRTQQKMYLNFDTSAIPTEALIIGAELRMYRSSATGTAAASLGPLVVDMRNPYLSPTSGDFGSSSALQAIDFQSFAHFPAVATLTVPASNTYTATTLNTAGLRAINKGGNTQMRLRFTLPDDGDFLADQVNFGSGNFGATSPGRPRLVVTYMMPCP